MATQAIRLRAESLRSVEYGDISSTYTAIGDPLENPARIFHLQNLTDVTLTWSMDGVNDHGVLASGSFILLDVTANKTLDQGEFVAEGTTFYIASIPGGDTPTSGDVYLSVFYGSRN